MLLRIDHVGIACRSLDAAIERYTSVFGLTVVSQETNAEQGVREAMLATSGRESYVQLLEPLGDDTPVGRFLARRGEGIHHVGYAVPDVVAALETFGGRGVRLIDERPRHGSMGASIAFLHPADLGGVLTELVQPRAARETLCLGQGAPLRTVGAAFRLPSRHGLEPPPGMGTWRTVKRPQTLWRRSNVPVTGRETRRSPRRGAIVLPSRRSRFAGLGVRSRWQSATTRPLTPRAVPPSNQDPGSGHMQSDIDAQLTSFFEETPPRDFAKVMRGYDPHQVDEHIRQLATEVRRHQEDAVAARRDLNDAHRQIQEQERPTYSWLGARIEQLLRLAEEQATELVQAARSEANEIKAAAKVDGAELRAAAENEAAELRANAKRETDEVRGAAEREADSIRTASRREADELTSTTEREVAKLRATADHEVAEKRAATERDIAKLRTTTEREVAQLKAAAKRERDEILTTSKRQADEMRSQAQRILEESEAQRAQAEAEFEIQLAARREEAERQEAERLSAAQNATQKLVSEAEQRASTAEQRAAKASAQADQTRRDADQHARQLVSNAKKNADQIVSQAKAQAESLMTEARTEAERRRVTAQREVDELTRQKDNIASHLAQVRQLLGGQLGAVPNVPNMDPSVGAPQAKPAIADSAPAPKPAPAPAPATAAAPAAARPAGNGTATAQAPRPQGNGAPAATAAASAQKGAGKENDEDWWTE